MLQLEIHTMHFDHIHLSSTPPRDNSFPAMQFCILFHCFFFYYYCYCYCYYTKQSQFVLPIYSWKCALLLEHFWLSSGCCLKKNDISKHPSIYNSSSVMIWALRLPFFSMLEFGQASVWTGLVYGLDNNCESLCVAVLL